MKILVKELGAIKEAKINLDKPLTLFCGQNNTGKTYLAYIIYALTRMKISRNPLKIDSSALIENSVFSFEIDIDQIFRYRNSTILEIKSNLDTVFGISEELAEQMFNNFEISFDSDLDTCKNKILDIQISEILNINHKKIKINKEKKSLTVKLEAIAGEDYSIEVKEGIFDMILSSLITNRIAFYPISNSVIFTVERNSIFTFSKELSISRNLLVEQMQKLSNGEKLNPFYFIQKSSNRYPLAIRDGLNVSDDLQNIQKTKGEFYDIACELEEKLLNGTLSVNKEGNLQFTTNKNKGKQLPIHMTASIVKTLSSLIFYLKYIAVKSDLIIIDEPEMNLHPDSQIILTRLFSKLLSKGFRLLISTHSDYIIRELNNLIMISSDKSEVKKIAEEMFYDLKDAIKPENVSCYYFHFTKPNARQLIVRELPVNKNGFEVESIDKEINDQNEHAMNLNYAINYQD